MPSAPHVPGASRISVTGRKDVLGIASSAYDGIANGINQPAGIDQGSCAALLSHGPRRIRSPRTISKRAPLLRLIPLAENVKHPRCRAAAKHGVVSGDCYFVELAALFVRHLAHERTARDARRAELVECSDFN